MKIRYLVSAVLIFVLQTLLLFPSAPAAAQEGNEAAGYNNVIVWVYPELDDPRLLVVIQGEIEETEFPATVGFLIPASAEIHALASRSEDQGLVNEMLLSREPSEIPDWDVVKFEVSSAIFWLEYYDALITGYPEKSVPYEFRWLYPITGLDIVIEEPYASTGFIAVPSGVVTTTPEGFIVHSYNDINPDFDDQPLIFDIAYTKQDTRPSLTILQAEAPPPTETGDEGEGLPSYLLIIIVVVAVGGLGVGAFFLVTRSSRMTRAERRQAARSKRKKAGESAPETGPGARFCHECGKPLSPGDRFCASCGTKVG